MSVELNEVKAQESQTVLYLTTVPEGNTVHMLSEDVLCFEYHCHVPQVYRCLNLHNDDSTTLLILCTALWYSLPVYANIAPLSHLYIWKPFVFVYLSQNGLCQRRMLTFQIHPSDPTAAATSVERSLTDNTLSDTWVMYKLQRATDLCSETVTEAEC